MSDIKNQATILSKPFRVVRKDNGSSNPHTGVVSLHRSQSAGEDFIARENLKLRRTPGYSTAWHPYELQRATELSDGSVEWERV